LKKFKNSIRTNLKVEQIQNLTHFELKQKLNLKKIQRTNYKFEEILKMEQILNWNKFRKLEQITNWNKF
jgi:hypothetical protein